MAKPLVVVESPAKAKTISKFLGDGYDVRASVGHVADLPSKGLAVDVDNGFKPTYELTDRGKQVVKDLRAALKDASELYLATDEDREGEAISWHLLEQLKPKVPVKRMVFHEITAAAIDHAVSQPARHRLRARRRRRDPAHPRPAVRLRGVTGAVAAGQPRPVGRSRAEPVGATDRRTRAGTHRVRCRRLLGHRAGRAPPPRRSRPAWSPSTGREGRHRPGLRRRRPGQRRRRRARRGPRAGAGAAWSRPTSPSRVEEKPYRSSPKAPFMTSTLQQEGGRSCACRRRR